MYELIRISEKCYYIQCPAKIGIYTENGKDVYLIDSGSDKDAGRKVRQILDANGWSLKAIFNTHSNADHIGGNKYLQAQTGCDIFAPGIECDFTQHTILEPAFLYGGYPYKDLKHKFLMAQESDVKPMTKDCLPSGLEMIELKGHFFDMVGFKSDDGTAFLADCLSAKSTLDKYGIGFIYDIEAYINTLEDVKNIDAKVFVPSHAEVTDSIAELADYNISAVKKTAETITKICEVPVSFETVLQKIFETYGLKMTHEQYVLIGSTVRSYLSYLKDKGEIDAYFENNTMLWKKVN